MVCSDKKLNPLVILFVLHGLDCLEAKLAFGELLSVIIFG